MNMEEISEKLDGVVEAIDNISLGESYSNHFDNICNELASIDRTLSRIAGVLEQAFSQDSYLSGLGRVNEQTM